VILLSAHKKKYIHVLYIRSWKSNYKLNSKLMHTICLPSSDVATALPVYFPWRIDSGGKRGERGIKRRLEGRKEDGARKW
jgi:hypothetical protein